MKKLSLLLCLSFVVWSSSGLFAATEETFDFGPFGKVTLYRPYGDPTAVVLFISGDGGWNKGVVDMARALTSLDAAVVGIDATRYLRRLEGSSEKCAYPAGDLEELSHFVQKKIGLPTYLPPVLVGYSSGATLVYGTVVQSPPSTFAGAISLGFCRDLEMNKMLCRGSGLDSTKRTKGKGYDLEPSATLAAPWIAFQGTIDQVCSSQATEAFVKRVPAGEFVSLPKVGHGFSVEKNWMSQFRSAFERVLSSTKAKEKVAEIRDLPLVEMAGSKGRGDLMAVVVSGDGGWAGIDREIGNDLSTRGVPVVGLNSLQYFWEKKTPESAGEDLGRIIAHYSAAWRARRVILVGYSFGADVLPYMLGNLPPDLRRMVSLAALLSPSEQAEFEFHVSNWIRDPGVRGNYPVLPAIRSVHGVRFLCFYGSEENGSICRKINQSGTTPVELKGGHHYGGDYAAIVDRILAGAEKDPHDNLRRE
jgi:type IV secretory pathway VirJ component